MSGYFVSKASTWLAGAGPRVRHRQSTGWRMRMNAAHWVLEVNTTNTAPFPGSPCEEFLEILSHSAAVALPDSCRVHVAPVSCPVAQQRSHRFETDRNDVNHHS